MSAKPVEEQHALGGTAIKPVGWDRSGFEAFKYLLYNPDTGEVLTRTPLSWLKITVFYIIYYSFLAGFWLACLNVFFLTLPENQPRWVLRESIIGDNPGVGVRPKMYDAKIDSSIYLLKKQDDDNTPTDDFGEGPKNIDYATRLELFMKGYETKDDLVECGEKETENRGKCIFDVAANLGACAESPYGYTGDAPAPCFLIKLNKIFEFAPKAVNSTQLDNPEFDLMSDALKERIRGAPDAENVYIDCRGRFAADKEAIALSYFPENQALPTKYFPYTGGNYHSPVVAVKVTPDATADGGQLVHIECRAWFDGVVHDTKDKAGLTQFEILIE